MSETNQPPDAGEDDKVDEAVEETFPASDPTAPSHPEDAPRKDRHPAKK